MSRPGSAVASSVKQEKGELNSASFGVNSLQAVVTVDTGSQQGNKCKGAGFLHVRPTVKVVKFQFTRSITSSLLTLKRAGTSG